MSCIRRGDIHRIISVDVETAGPNPADYALLSIGACTLDVPRNEFYIELQPISMKEDAEALAAGDLNELMRCWENVHRMWQAEAHVRTILARQETRWPGYYFRTDTPEMLDDWKVFMNCKYDASTDQWDMIKRPIIELID